MEYEELRLESEMEADSDHDDADYGAGEMGSEGGWLGQHLHNFHEDLDSYETGTVRRRAKTIVTPKMAMESFRLSFLNDDQDVNFDAILGELYELESQLNSAQTELSRSLGTGGHHPPPPAAFQDGESQESSEIRHSAEQEELDQLAVEITRSLHYNKPPGHCSYHHRHYHHHHTLGGPGHIAGESVCDTTETDSAFSDNASLPSSESLTSMVTVSSSADTNSSSSGETCSMSSAICGMHHIEAEHTARMKAEKIRIALEKIKEAKIRKLFVRAFAKDGSSKSILVDEKMSVSQVCSQLADKNHMRLNHRLSVVELMPELLMERILEDHDSLVENIVMWTRDSKNKVMFEERMDKYDLFINPEKYLLSPTVSKQEPLTAQQKDKLIQEFFAPDCISVPTVEGALYLKSDGKKAWKKFFFVLRASGLYYNPKGKASKNPKDLVCLVQFEYVEIYRGLGWKKKYHSPTDYCFALKHPQIQKKTSKYIRYFCAETETALDQWVMGIRTVKLGKQMLYNYEQLMHEISMWDLRQQESGAVSADETMLQMLNHTDLSDSRMSVPDHAVIQVLNATVGSATGDSARDIISIEVLAIPPCKTSEYGGGSDGRSLCGSIGSSSIGSGISESSHKTPVKRVSFSATHSIINGDQGEHGVKHRDSIISASTDSSEDSNSSGEIRVGTSFRGKMRPKLPVTTETTRQLADMCNVSMDETAEGIYAETHHRALPAGLSRTDRRRSSINERRGSCGSAGSDTSQRSSQMKGSPLSPSLKQHSFDSGAEASVVRGKHGSASPESHYQHVRRKSEPVVVSHSAKGKEESTYSSIYSPLREEQGVLEEVDSKYSCKIDHQQSEPLYNQIRGPDHMWSHQVPSDIICPVAIPPPPEFREAESGNNHIPSSSNTLHEQTPSGLAAPVQLQSTQVPPPAPPVSSTVAGHLIDAVSSPHKLHQLKESHYNTAVSVHSKSSPPPTFPKPHSSPANSVSSTSPTPTAVQKQPPPPPPLRMSSGDSIYSSRSGVDSASGSPLHVPVPPPMPPIIPKLPPPTLPKTSHATTAALSGVTGNSIKSSLSSKPPQCDGQSKKENVQPDHSQSNHEGQQKDVLNETLSCPPQSPSLPFLSELSKRTHPESGVDISSVEMRNGQSSPVSQQHRRSASAGGMISKTDKKILPPPPPKRSENTRLSGDLTKQQQHSETVANGASLPIPDPIYENFDGIMDIDELPPPPPELLMDLPPSECEDQNLGSIKKSKPPPPPPKRSKDTQLSSH